MEPMLSSVWLTLVPAVLEAQYLREIVVIRSSLRNVINIVSNRVGLFTQYDIWVHQCYPRAVYSRLRNHAHADSKGYPRARFTCKLSDLGTNSLIKASMFMNGDRLKYRSPYDNTNYVWHWLRTLATFYTGTNHWSSNRQQCHRCHVELTKKERALLNLNILGRKLNGSRLA